MLLYLYYGKHYACSYYAIKKVLLPFIGSDPINSLLLPYVGSFFIKIIKTVDVVQSEVDFDISDIQSFLRKLTRGYITYHLLGFNLAKLIFTEENLLTCCMSSKEFTDGVKNTWVYRLLLEESSYTHWKLFMRNAFFNALRYLCDHVDAGNIKKQIFLLAYQFACGMENAGQCALLIISLGYWKKYCHEGWLDKDAALQALFKLSGFLSMDLTTEPEDMDLRAFLRAVELLALSQSSAMLARDLFVLRVLPNAAMRAELAASPYSREVFRVLNADILKRVDAGSKEQRKELLRCRLRWLVELGDNAVAEIPASMGCTRSSRDQRAIAMGVVCEPLFNEGKYAGLSIVEVAALYDTRKGLFGVVVAPSTISSRINYRLLHRRVELLLKKLPETFPDESARGVTIFEWQVEKWKEDAVLCKRTARMLKLLFQFIQRAEGSKKDEDRIEGRFVKDQLKTLFLANGSRLLRSMAQVENKDRLFINQNAILMLLEEPSNIFSVDDLLIEADSEQDREALLRVILKMQGRLLSEPYRNRDEIRRLDLLIFTKLCSSAACPDQFLELLKQDWFLSFLEEHIAADELIQNLNMEQCSALFSKPIISCNDWRWKFFVSHLNESRVVLGFLENLDRYQDAELDDECKRVIARGLFVCRDDLFSAFSALIKNGFASRVKEILGPLLVWIDTALKENDDYPRSLFVELANRIEDDWLFDQVLKPIIQENVEHIVSVRDDAVTSLVIARVNMSPLVEEDPCTVARLGSGSAMAARAGGGKTQAHLARMKRRDNPMQQDDANKHPRWQEGGTTAEVLGQLAPLFLSLPLDSLPQPDLGPASGGGAGGGAGAVVEDGSAARDVFDEQEEQWAAAQGLKFNP
jgi:hypothetical protein